MRKKRISNTGTSPHATTITTNNNNNTPSTKKHKVSYSTRASPRQIAKGTSQIKVKLTPKQRAKPKKEALIAALTAAMGDEIFIKEFTGKSMISDGVADDTGTIPDEMTTGVHFVQNSGTDQYGHFRARRFKNPKDEERNVKPTKKNTDYFDSYSKKWQRLKSHGLCQTFAIMAYMRSETDLEKIVQNTQRQFNDDQKHVMCSRIALKYIAEKALPKLLRTGVFAKHIRSLRLHCYLWSFVRKPQSKVDTTKQLKLLRPKIYQLTDDEDFPEILFNEEYTICAEDYA